VKPEVVQVPICEAAPVSLTGLSEGERRRVVSFRSARRRAEFVATRRALRQQLAERVGVNPEAVPIDIDEDGKPLLGQDGVYFNLSHTVGLGLVAVADTPVGVDVELADRAVPELPFLDELAAALGVSKVLAWCLVEAVIKAHGSGLAGVQKLRWSGRDANEAVFEIDGVELIATPLEMPERYVGAVATVAA